MTEVDFDANNCGCNITLKSIANRANTPQKLRVKIEEYLMFSTKMQDLQSILFPYFN